ncbi:glycosyl transferase, group 1 [Candidatus Omnitrophus magneticus]|uniref:Glycosyl transferase, group 1 n=1 Tax=Candidatus Omnitrophus magneticus TaxID=1609969 RepID=A0A0F0CPS4_9BACT|nr:glycosyl transferase, group 1 [Candidatus Omnitrophus magneticus]
MKIGFDARMISHPGIGKYIECLLKGIISISDNNEFILFADINKLKIFQNYKNVKCVNWNAPIYSGWEQIFNMYPLQKLDVLHVPHFNIPLFFSGRLVVTIHDLIYLLIPSSSPSKLGKIYTDFMIKSSLQKSKSVIAVSENTKKDLIKIYSEKYAEKINVIYEAPSPEFQPITDRTLLADIRCRYRLEENFILYVGSIKPHKNVGTLIEVFKLLKQWGAPHKLVICGRWDKKEDYLKDKLIDKDIRYLGEIPASDIAGLYNLADLLVHLSLYEGFGLTIVEAMSSGLPVVALDSSSMPEVIGDAGILVPAGNNEQIANTIYNVLVNGNMRNIMKENSLEQARKFSWDKTAKATLDVYKKVAGSGA